MKNHRMRNLKVGIFICLTTLMGAWLLASEGSQEHHNADLGVETTDETTAPVPSDTDEVDTANNPALVEITTQFGSMIVQLSDSTPQHRDNFLKLVEEQYYDGLIFHRVIQDFMIQGGDPQSREASANSRLGNGGPGYTIEAEIRPDLIHTKGALAAARQGDNVNPQRRSSGSQFYIVQGRPFGETELEGIENRIANFAQEYGNGLANVEDGQFAYSDEAREAYMTEGGTPFLDMQYTVFGQVISGLEIIDIIASVQTDRQRGDRPVQDVVMSMKRIQ